MAPKLNPVQRRAVEHLGSPLLVLAGAGTGKTRVVTQRILWLLRRGVPAHNILALTFSNKAAQEMRSRVLAELEEARGLSISTFHSLGARFLRQHSGAFGRSPRFLIYDDREQLRLIQQLLKRQGREQARTEARSIQGAIEEARNRGESADQALAPQGCPDLDMEALGRSYELQLRLSDAFDFGDLIRCPGLLMAQDPQLCSGYQQRWPWILVDEFQDTNEAQHRWLKLLAPPGSNLTAVGDEDQAIYGWRGARMEHILEFNQTWPSAEILRLEQNYRSRPQILKVANALICHNQRRLGKQLWTEHPPGPEPVIYRAPADLGRGRR